MARAPRSPVPAARRPVDARLVLAIIIGLQLVCSVLLFDPKLFTGGDDAVYLILARALATGAGYRDISMPGSPLHTQYPPGFPALLAPLSFDHSFITPKVFCLLAGLGASVLFYFLVRDRRRPAFAYLPVAVFATLPLVIEYSHWVLTEIPFLFISLLTIVLLRRSETGPRRALFFGLGIAGLVLAVYIRTAGIALVGAFAVYYLVRRQWIRALLVAALPALALVPWVLRGRHAGPEGSYVAQLLARNPYELTAGTINIGDYLRRVGNNIGLYFLVVPEIFFPFITSIGVLAALGVVLTGLALLGAVARLRRHGLTPWGLYTLVFLLITVSWPKQWSGDRFLIPLLPFIILYLAEGLESLGAMLRLRRLGLALAVLVISNLAVNIAEMPRSIANLAAYADGDHRAGYPREWRNYFDAIDWIAQNTPADAVVMARKPQFVYLYSGRRSFVFPFSSDVNTVIAAMDRAHATYLLLDFFTWSGTSRRILIPVIRAHPERFELYYQTPRPEMFVLGIVPPSAP